MRQIVLCFMLLLLLGHSTPANGVSCEWFGRYDFGGERTCYMNGTTSISSSGIAISSLTDASVGAFHLEYNKKIVYLPENTGEKFVNLLKFLASNCAIKTISKSNFKGLRKLIWLHLFTNVIETIPNDAFEDLESMENLSLYGNKIKFMNGVALSSISAKAMVLLHANVCINEIFAKHKGNLATMSQVVTEKCGFSDERDILLTSTQATPNKPECECEEKAEKTNAMLETLQKGQEQQMGAFKAFTDQTVIKMKRYQEINTQNLVTIAVLENQLKLKETEVVELRNALKHKQEEYEELLRQKPQNQWQTCY